MGIGDVFRGAVNGAIDQIRGDAVRQNAPPDVQHAMDRADTLANKLSGLGGGKDRGSHNDVVHKEPLAMEARHELYERNGYAANIVDRIVDDATREHFEVSVSDEMVSNVDVNKELKRIGLLGAMSQADKWSRVDGGAIVLLGINDGQSFSREVDTTAVQNLDFAVPVEKENVDIIELESDPTANGDVGEPSMYRVNTDLLRLNRTSFGFGGNGTIEVHASRVLRFDGVTVAHHRRDDYDYWGLDQINRIWEVLSALIMCEYAMGNVAHLSNQGIWKLKGLSNIARGKSDHLKRVIDRIAAINISRSMLGMMLMDMDNEAFEQVQPQVGHLEVLHKRLTRAAAAQADMPQALFAGDSPSGLSTDDKSGARNWATKVSSHRSDTYDPKVHKVVRLMLASARQLKLAEVASAVGVEWPALYEPTEDEKLEVELKRAKVLQVYLQLNVVKIDEARAILRTNDFLPSAADVEALIAADAELPELDEPEQEDEGAITTRGGGMPGGV